MSLDFSTIRAVTLDLDGVVWRGDILLPGTPGFFRFLSQRGIPYLFLSNNSTRTPPEYVAKLTKIGIPVEERQVINSGIVTKAALARMFPPGTPLYVVGSQSLSDLLASAGFVIDPDNAQVVVVGLDTHLTYEKLTIAGRRILAGARFIGTNGDLSFPAPDGLTPGAGSILAAVQAMTGVRPTLMGKPGAAMFELALERLGIPAGDTLMIGDRLDTDIAGGAGVGMRTALVLTGVTGEGAIEDDTARAIRPDAVFDHLAAIQAAWEGA